MQVGEELSRAMVRSPLILSSKLGAHVAINNVGKLKSARPYGQKVGACRACRGELAWKDVGSGVTSSRGGELLLSPLLPLSVP